VEKASGIAFNSHGNISGRAAGQELEATCTGSKRQGGTPFPLAVGLPASNLVGGQRGSVGGQSGVSAKHAQLFSLGIGSKGQGYLPPPRGRSVGHDGMVGGQRGQPLFGQDFIFMHTKKKNTSIGRKM
jgi:hypothetical protein